MAHINFLLAGYWQEFHFSFCILLLDSRFFIFVLSTRDSLSSNSTSGFQHCTFYLYQYFGVSRIRKAFILLIMDLVFFLNMRIIIAPSFKCVWSYYHIICIILVWPIQSPHCLFSLDWGAVLLFVTCIYCEIIDIFSS